MLTKAQYVARYHQCLANAERTESVIAQLWLRLADSYHLLAAHEMQAEAERNLRGTWEPHSGK